MIYIICTYYFNLTAPSTTCVPEKNVFGSFFLVGVFGTILKSHCGGKETDGVIEKFLSLTCNENPSNHSAFTVSIQIEDLFILRCTHRVYNSQPL